jgi:hypothetical protein
VALTVQMVAGGGAGGLRSTVTATGGGGSLRVSTYLLQVVLVTQ